VKTASELLDLTPPAPLAAILSVRPVRVCVLVPSAEGVPWQRMVEHAIATQTRVWGGAFNLVVPTGWELAEDELFWRLVDLIDPDVLGIHMPRYSDAEEIAPDVYDRAMEDSARQLNDLGSEDEGMLAAHLKRLGNEPTWRIEPSDLLTRRLIERTAPLTVGREGKPRTVYFDGSSGPSYPFTDAAVLREIPRTAHDIRTTLGDLDQLLLTNSAGRLLHSTRGALVEHGVNVFDVIIESEHELLRHVWPRPGDGIEPTLPISLSMTGLGQRVRLESFDRVVVVVGDEPRDFLLFHGLTRVRPFVYWLPHSRQSFVYVGWLVFPARVSFPCLSAPALLQREP
jgi:hypothetical protein